MMTNLPSNDEITRFDGTYIHSFNHIPTIHNSFIRRHLPWPLSISSSLVSSVEKPPCGAEPRIKSGLPYSKATRYQLNNAAPYYMC
jgi:hypothetical protein